MISYFVLNKVNYFKLIFNALKDVLRAFKKTLSLHSILTSMSVQKNALRIFKDTSLKHLETTSLKRSENVRLFPRVPFRQITHRLAHRFKRY